MRWFWPWLSDWHGVCPGLLIFAFFTFGFFFLSIRGSRARRSDEECSGKTTHTILSGIVVGRRRTFPNSPGVRHILALAHTHALPILRGPELRRGVFTYRCRYHSQLMARCRTGRVSSWGEYEVEASGDAVSTTSSCPCLCRDIEFCPLSPSSSKKDARDRHQKSSGWPRVDNQVVQRLKRGKHC